MNGNETYRHEKFKMPGLDKYWCYPDGKVWHIKAEYFMQVQADGYYHTYDDCYDLSPIAPKEIITYHQHLMDMFSRMTADETEVVIYRPYRATMHAIVDSEGKEVMILNNYLREIAISEGIPEHYKIVKY